MGAPVVQPATASEGDFAAWFSSLTTARQPSRMLGYLGDHPHSTRSLRLGIRCERPSTSPNDPVTYVNQAGRSLGEPTPSTSARASENARRRIGSSSATL